MVETFHDRIENAMKAFNETYGSEVSVRLVDFQETEFSVEFFGRFSETCDVHTYFETFEFEFDDDEREHIRRVSAAEDSPKVWRVRYLIMS